MATLSMAFLKPAGWFLAYLSILALDDGRKGLSSLFLYGRKSVPLYISVSVSIFSPSRLIRV